MGGITLEMMAEELYKLTTGEISTDGVSMAWDFTEGLSKEEWKNRWVERETKTYIRNGRIMMPELNII